VLDHRGRVVAAALQPGPRQQPRHQHRFRRLKVDRGLQGEAVRDRDAGRGGRLREVAREAVEDEPAPRGGGGDRRHQHVEHDLVGDQVTAGLVGGDLTAKLGVAVGGCPQQIARRDVLGTGPGRQPFALGALARAGRGEQQQPHDAASLVTVIILPILHGCAARPT